MKSLGGTNSLWKGGVNLGDRLSHVAPANQPPVAGPDAAMVLAGCSVNIDVLHNDIDLEGGALTVTGATADQGSATANPDGTIRYTAPAGFSGTARVTYTVVDTAGARSQATAAVEVVRLSISEGATEGEFVVTTVPGELSLTVIEPAECAGSFVLRTDDLAAGPVMCCPRGFGGPPPRVRR